MTWIVEPREMREEQVASVVDRIGRGERVEIRGGAGQGKTRFARAVACRTRGSVLVTIPDAADRIEHTVLAIAAELGSGARRAAHEELRSHPGRPGPALRRLEPLLGGRPLIVDGLERLAAPGSDEDGELEQSFAEDRSALRAWLGERAALRTHSQDGEILSAPSIPLALRNGADKDLRGLWDTFGHNPLRFRLAVGWCLMREEEPSALEEAFPNEYLLAQTWQCTPPALRDLVLKTACHGRPLRTDVLAALHGQDFAGDVRLAMDALLLDQVGGAVEAPAPWVRWCRERLPEQTRQQAHRQLADAFSRRFDLRDDRAYECALDILDAHRHCVLGLDHEKARELALYGCGPLLDHARALSWSGQREGASRVYDLVLALDRGMLNPAAATPAAEGGIGRRPRAYARHYYHYNRAKAQPVSLEDIRLTIDGYRASVDGWWENALFWSRLVLADFHADQPARAMRELAEAERAVRPHARKSYTLRGRTAAKLLEAGKLEAALSAWGAGRALGIGMRQVEAALLDAGARGWSAELLRSCALEVVFTRAVHMSLRRVGDRIACSIDDLDLVERGDTIDQALEAVVRQVRDLASRLLTTLTHELSAEERARKRHLLGLVDPVASRLLPQVAEVCWVLGTLRPGAEGLCFEGADGLLLPVPAAVAAGASADGLFRFARVKAGAMGEPAGPIDELGPPLAKDPEAIERAWIERLRRGA